MEKTNDEPLQRRPLDIYDPSPEGITPYTLEETLAAAVKAVNSLHELQAALLGCRTPVNFRPTAHAISKLQATLAQDVEVIRQAKDVIELDRPLGRIEIEGPFEDPWEDILSPHQILQQRLRARQVAAEDTVTYREVVLAADPVPPLVERHQKRAAAAATVASMTEEERAEAATKRVPRVIRAALEELDEPARKQLVQDTWPYGPAVPRAATPPSGQA